MKELCFAILITVITFSVPGIAASASTATDHADYVKGNTPAIPDGESIALRLNEAVYSSDKIATGDWSRVRLSMNDSDKNDDTGTGANSEAVPSGVADTGAGAKPSTIPDITPNALKANPPKAAPPKGTQPKIQAPKVHAPKVNPPKVHAPKVQAPKVNPPKIQAPKVHTPKIKPPKIHPPKH